MNPTDPHQAAPHDQDHDHENDHDHETVATAVTGDEPTREPAPEAAPAADTESDTESGTESVEQLLRRLEESVRAVPEAEPVGFTQLVTDTTGHADALRETLSAQQEAQEMLAAAQKVRAAASSQAEKIVREARDAAERVHEESRQHAEQSRLATSAWAREQRERVEKIVAELVESATRDADRIRDEAVATALAKAEETGRQHVAQAMAQGERDAEAIREEARQLLRQSTSVVSLATTSLENLGSTVGEAAERLSVQVHAMQLLTRDAEQRLTDHHDPTPDEEVELVEGEDEVDAALGDLLPAAGSPAESPEPETQHSEPESAAPRAGRPLGSLFRGPEAG